MGDVDYLHEFYAWEIDMETSKQKKLITHSNFLVWASDDGHEWVIVAKAQTTNEAMDKADKQPYSHIIITGGCLWNKQSCVESYAVLARYPHADDQPEQILGFST